MEEWQRKHITQNLHELIQTTEFKSSVKAYLVAKNILSQIDVEELDAESDRKGKSAACYKLYERLLTRVGAYNVLLKALEENKQSGAAKILLSGFQSLENQKELDGFQDVEVDVQGKRFKLHEIFTDEKPLALTQQIFQDMISETEFYDAFVTKSKTFVLATSNIPPEPPLYIPRFLSNRIVIDESIFKNVCPDVFVFRNNIERYKLSEIASSNWTAPSNSQLSHITARFIYLDEYEDWTDLKNLAKVPIHLISYNKAQNEYILEDTSAALEILSKVGSKKQRVYMSEDEFVVQQISQDLKVSSVCICDTPGMGKTYLLENLARKMAQICTGRIIVWIQLSAFMAEVSQMSSHNSEDQNGAFLIVFKHISPTQQHANLLVEMVKADLLRVEIFFDGFDEIPLEKVEWMKKVFHSIRDKLSNVRIYITSRPHMRHELERSLGVIAFDILPFNIQNQAEYLVKFWSSDIQNFDQETMRKCARNCLETVNKGLTKNDKEIAGSPLLCRLIAEVYANKVHSFANSKLKNVHVALKIATMYQQFTKQRIRNVTQNEDEFEMFKLAHIYQALNLLFPTDNFHEDKIFTHVEPMTQPNSVFKAGILQMRSNEKLEFIHRTFAEYFVAEYFFRKFQATPTPRSFFRKHFYKSDETEKWFSSILNLRMQTFPVEYIHPQEKNFYIPPFDKVVFVHSVILSFLDFKFTEIKFPDEIRSRIAVFCASILPKEFLLILCACCHHKLYNLFSQIKESVATWNWFQKKRFFTPGNCFKLLSYCIWESSNMMFHICIQLLTDVLTLDIEQIVIYDRKNTLLHKAAAWANYEAVEYFLNISVSIELGTVLEKCMAYSSRNDLDMEIRRENILLLLLRKCPSILNTTPYILFERRLNLKFFKKLVELEANLNSVKDELNCAMNAATYMPPGEFHGLVEFLLTNCNAEHLFQYDDKWKHPLPHIIQHAMIFSKTMDLLLKIPIIDINMKDENGENLLFYAVRGNQMGNLNQLVKRGLDYNARGENNINLLHVAAAKWRGVEIVSYLLSLKLDANYRNEKQWTPLHYAAYNNELSVVEILLKNGAYVQVKNNKGQTALHLSVAPAIFPKIEVIKYLIENGAGVNDRDNGGNTPLHLCRWKHVSDCLIELGASIHAKNKKEKTPSQVNPHLVKTPTNLKDHEKMIKRYLTL